MEEFDLILVGAGLANGLIALNLLHARPQMRIAMIEAGQIGGNHTWCFQESDVPASALPWLGPLISHSWARQDVHFPGRSRRLANGYRAVTSARFREVLAGARLTLLAPMRAVGIAPDRVTLEDGRELRALTVIDGRGQRPSRHLDVRAQKFVGLEVRTAAAHGLSAPVIMDARIPQRDGYRFFYVLPLAADRLLIEDTRYSDAMALDRAALRADVLDYARANHWQIADILREEDGVLPVALGGDIAAFWAEGPAGLARSGLAGGFFHPMTGYSLPDGVCLAQALAALPSLTSASAHAAARGLSMRLWRERRFFRMLARMLFDAAMPDQRWRVLRRHYGLGEGLIARFYAARLTLADKIRILAGKPPVPIGAALASLLRPTPMPPYQQIEPT